MDHLEEIKRIRQQSDYFKYQLYGTLSSVTSYQFIYKIPILDLQIAGSYLVANILLLIAFWGSMFSGLQYFTIFYIAYSVIFLISCLYFKFSIETQLEVINSIIYKIYCFSRLCFITFGLMDFAGKLVVIIFLYNFENFTSFHFEIKEQFLNEKQKLNFSIERIFLFTILYSLFFFYCLTHQIYWQYKLESSWSQNNIGIILRKIKERVNKEDTISNQIKQQRRQSRRLSTLSEIDELKSVKPMDEISETDSAITDSDRISNSLVSNRN